MTIHGDQSVSSHYYSTQKTSNDIYCLTTSYVTRLTKSFLSGIQSLNCDGILLINGRLHNSSNIITTLANNKHLVTDASDIRILEQGIGNSQIRSIRFGIWLKRMGLKDRRRPWKLTTQVRAYPDVLEHGHGVFKAFLLASNSYQEYVLGVFHNMSELNSFKDQYYSSNEINEVIVSSNELTKDYYAV